MSLTYRLTELAGVAIGKTHKQSIRAYQEHLGNARHQDYEGCQGAGQDPMDQQVLLGIAWGE
jgi:hypothetical protein